MQYFVQEFDGLLPISDYHFEPHITIDKTYEILNKNNKVDGKPQTWRRERERERKKRLKTGHIAYAE